VQNRVSNYLHLPHGFVLFDQGEGTPQRSYIHFSEASGSGTVRPRSSTNILERLSHEPFDAVLRKGAMDFFDSVETQAEIQRLMVNLISRQGLWIDGDSMESDGENISVRRKNLPQLLDSWGLRLQIQMNRTQIEGFGYGLVEFVRFKLTH
jgi:hypothetical protein